MHNKVRGTDFQYINMKKLQVLLILYVLGSFGCVEIFANGAYVAVW